MHQGPGFEKAISISQQITITIILLSAAATFVICEDFQNIFRELPKSSDLVIYRAKGTDFKDFNGLWGKLQQTS